MKDFNQINLRRFVLASFIYIACTIQAQAQTQEPFVTTWEVTAGDLSITIPTNIYIPANSYDYTVDWGDGTTDTTTYTDDATYTYQAAGTYTVTISGDFPAIYFNNLSPQAGDNSLKIKTIKSWGTQQWLTLFAAFAGCQNLTTIEDGAGVPDLTMVTSMDGAFFGATSFNGDLSSWGVSNVTNMGSTFYGATSFNGDLSSWNVSKVTDMNRTFFGANNFNGDLSSWNVSNVVEMWRTFQGATNFNSDLSSWDVSIVTNMGFMLGKATNFNGDLSSWNVSNVIYMIGTFLDATNFNSDLSRWNVSNVIHMGSTFERATSFNGDLSTWDVSNVTDMAFTFYEASSFNGDISSWNVSNVNSMVGMFSGATNFSSENYDALLTGWSSLPTLKPNVRFTPPPTTYCAGQAGREKLTKTVAEGGYNWGILGDTGLDCPPLSLSIKVFLQGAYDTNSKMNASLLTAGDQDTNIIPTTSPYEDGATVESTVFDITTGDNAIVDWVQVSLHNPNDVSVVISTKPALLQRDGDVVALDGSSGLQIQGIAGYYKVSINHRNHIPVITDAAQSLSATETAIDFTNDLTIVTGGSNAMAEVETGIYALFSGDVDENNQVQVDDYNAAIQDVGRGGYLISDINMNGETQVDDINLILETLGKGAQF